MEKIKPGIYRHYKGNEYRVHFVVKHSETGEEMVVYEALYNNEKSKFWVRPAKMWNESVDINEEKKPRFEWVRES
ncbi:MAG TPA: DUF1653 domain-containing protein [Candidatus Paceibacterota bacterium]